MDADRGCRIASRYRGRHRGRDLGPEPPHDRAVEVRRPREGRPEEARGGARRAAGQRSRPSRSCQSGSRRSGSKPLSSPVVIALIGSPRKGENVVPQEEIVAAGAALQNMLLAAHSLGLATSVRTGAHSYSEEVRGFFEMGEGESLIGMVYVGYACGAVPPGGGRPSARRSPGSRTERERLSSPALGVFGRLSSAWRASRATS